MVRTIQAEDAVQQLLNQLLQARSAAEVGLLVGTLGGSARDSILFACKTPDVEGESPLLVSQKASGSGKKGKDGRPTQGAQVAVSLMEEGIVEHAHQVMAMLPGGLDVVGLYLFCPEAAFQAASPQIVKVLRQISDARCALPGKESVALLALSMCSATRKMALKEQDRVLLRPCEIQIAPVLANLREVFCRHHVDTVVTVPSSGKSSLAMLREAVEAEGRAVKVSWCAANGKIIPDATLLGDVAAAPPQTTRAEVSLLMPIGIVREPSGGGAAPQPDIAGRLRLTGWVHARVIGHKREAWDSVALKLKADICHTLQSRISLLEMGASDLGPSEGEGDAPLLLTLSTAPFAFHLPRRVFFPVKDFLQVCDYIEGDEDVAEIANAASQLLSLPEVSADQVEVPPALSEERPLETYWEPSRRGPTGKNTSEARGLIREGMSAPSGVTSPMLLLGLLLLVLAAVVGAFLLY